MLDFLLQNSTIGSAKQSRFPLGFAASRAAGCLEDLTDQLERINFKIGVGPWITDPLHSDQKQCVWFQHPSSSTEPTSLKTSYLLNIDRATSLGFCQFRECITKLSWKYVCLDARQWTNSTNFDHHISLFSSLSLGANLRSSWELPVSPFDWQETRQNFRCITYLMTPLWGPFCICCLSFTIVNRW